MSRGLTVLLVVACGAAVGNVYFAQAISPAIAEDLRVTPGAAAAVVGAVQFGYAIGIFLLVPLGDRIPYRTLIVAMFCLTGAGLLAASRAGELAPLVAASACVGVTTTASQVIAPMVAGLVPAARRGVYLGTLLSGSIAGTVLARGLGGTLAAWLGWRAPYTAAGVVALAMAAALAVALPRTPAPPRRRYRTLLAEPVRLLRAEPELRDACASQAAVFAAWSAAWTGVALLLTGPEYGLGTQAVGLLALVGIGTMACTPMAGHHADRHGPERVGALALAGALASAAVLAGGTYGGALGIAALAAGLLLLDAAMQSGMAANQTRILGLRDDARSRLNTALVTCIFLGGSAGSFLGAQAYVHVGWPAVCALVALLTGLALWRTRRRALGRVPRPARGSARG